MAARAFSVETVMKAFDFCVNNLEGSKLWIKKVGYNMSAMFPVFHNKGTKCKVCGIEGTYFKEYRQNGKRHLRLCTDVEGVFINVDHTFPRCAGGSNQKTNKEPLCSVCNGHWKSGFDNQLKHRVLGVSTAGVLDEYLYIME